MMKGDKIKLKKKIGTFGHIGAICEVTDVSEDGIISFRYGNQYLTMQNYKDISPQTHGIWIISIELMVKSFRLNMINM